jgi:hypothetical protein
MNDQSLGVGLVGLWVVAGALGCGDDDGCGVADPVGTIEAAEAGDVLGLEGCTVVGPVTVPPGVTVEGSRNAPVVFQGPEGARATVELGGAGGGRNAVLRDAVVTGRARFAVLAREAEAIRLERVRIEHDWGIGLLIDGVTTVELDTVTLRGSGPDGATVAADQLFVDVVPVAVTGPLDDCSSVGEACTHGTSREASCEDGSCGPYVVTCDCGRERTVLTTTGLFADRFDAFTARDLQIERYGEFGAVLVGSADATVDWRGGGAREIHGTGLYVSGPSAALESVEVSDVYQGFRAAPAFGLLEASSDRPGDIETRGLTVERAEGYGIYQVGAANTHQGLAIRDARDGGYWALSADRIRIEGGELAGNGLTAMMFQEAGEVALSGGLVVRDTIRRRTTIGGSGLQVLEAGDGLQLIDTTENVELNGVDFLQNERVGLFYDGGDGFDPDSDLCRGGAGVCFRDVLVEGVDDQRGALAGDPVGLIGAGDDVASYRVVAGGAWTGDLVRAGSAENDVTVDGIELDFVGVTGPLDFPDPTAVTGPLD